MKKNIMIKTAIAGAVVAATTATTIADTNLYGRFRAGIECTDNGSDTDCGLKNGSSRFGIKVDQEVTDGLTAFGKYEFGVNLDEGALSNREEENRLAYVGLRGGFGEVSIGTRWSPMYNFVSSPVDPYQMFGGEGGVISVSSERVSDTIHYKNKIGTTLVHTMIQMDDGDTGSDEIDLYQIGAGFKAGPVNLGVAYSDETDGDSQIGVHAGASLGAIALGASVINQMPDGNGDDVVAVTLNGNFGLGGGRSVNVNLGLIDEEDETPTVIGAEYENRLTKNVRWFAGISAEDKDDGSDDIIIYGAGMRLEF